MKYSSMKTLEQQRIERGIGRVHETGDKIKIDKEKHKDLIEFTEYNDKRVKNKDFII